MAKIQNVSSETKAAIRRKSAYTLPNNPTDSGYKADDIRNAFYKPIIDITNSALTEIDRVINEMNNVLGVMASDVDSIESVAGVNYHGSEGLIFTFSNDCFTVSGNEDLEGKVVIPSSVFYLDKYYPVVAISESAFEGSAITEAEIPSSVESIGDKAFYSCSNLTKVTFYGSTSLGTNAFTSGKIDFYVPNEYLTAYTSSLAAYKNTLTGFDTIANNALNIATLFSEKVTKVTGESSNQRVYAISETGAQVTRKLVETPTEGEIPIYLTGGRIPVGTATQGTDATNKTYVEGRLATMGAYISFTIDPTDYKMTLQLKNESGTVLSEGVVDLPLESMILGATYSNGVLTLNIKTADGTMNNTSIKVNISDLISGLVSESDFNDEVERLDDRITSANQDHSALVAEVDQKEIYAHAAFYSEEAEGARNFIGGGSIDRALRKRPTGLQVALNDEYVLSIALINEKGEEVSKGEVDFPIEGLITTATYASKTLTLTLQNGNKVNIDISDIISGLVPDSRTINDKPLTADITITASDVEAYTKSETDSKVANAKVALQEEIEEAKAVGFALESERTSGVIKGSSLDKRLTKIEKALNEITGG